MKLKTTLLAALGCLFTLATSCKDPDDNNKTQYATNKAGERLVEKIKKITIQDNNDTLSYSYHLEYNNDGTLKKITEFHDIQDGGSHYSDQRIYSFELKNNTLFFYAKFIDEEGTEEASETFDLNKSGLITSTTNWDNEQFRLSYDETGKYLHNVFKEDELIWTFNWVDGNIFNERVKYIPQSHSSNIDWGAFFQTWRNDNNEDLVDISCIRQFWGFSDGYLGNKCKGLPFSFGSSNYTYDFTEDGFVSSIHVSNEWETETIQVTYLKK